MNVYNWLVISIHALRGEGDDSSTGSELSVLISIHALRGEGDRVFFQLDKLIVGISIHALRGEGDDTTGIVAHRDGA